MDNATGPTRSQLISRFERRLNTVAVNLGDISSERSWLNFLQDSFNFFGAIQQGLFDLMSSSHSSAMTLEGSGSATLKVFYPSAISPIR
jgi:hypothetical protein